MAPGEEVKALAAASPSAKAADGMFAPAGGGSAGGLGDGLGGGISASKFIALPGNAGPKSTLISLRIERSSDDSDEDETGGSASSMDHEVVSKRNLSMMNKHKLKIQRSQGRMGQVMGCSRRRLLKPKLSCTALSFRPAGRSFSFVAFRLVWFWRYELLWPRGFSRRGRRGGHAHAASSQRGSMPLTT